MTPEELLAKFAALGPRQDLAVLLQFLADHIYEAQLGDGKVSDVIDCKIWLEELAKAANSRMLGKSSAKMPAAQPRWGSWPR